MTSTKLEFISPENETERKAVCSQRAALGRQLQSPGSLCFPLCHFEGVVLFLLTTRTLAACLCSRKTMLRCTCLLSFKEDKSRVFLVVYSMCTCTCICRRTFTTGCQGLTSVFHREHFDLLTPLTVQKSLNSVFSERGSVGLGGRGENMCIFWRVCSNY